MFFIVTGQVIMLARAAASAAAPEADGEGESMPDEAADMQATRWGGGATMSWWGLNGRGGQAVGEDDAWYDAFYVIQCLAVLILYYA